MLKINVPSIELYNTDDNTFICYEECELYLEHSLKSIAEWESMYQKVFLSSEEKTINEFIEYIKMMTLDEPMEDLWYANLPRDVISKIKAYIDSTQTAEKTPSDEKKTRHHEIITSDLMYCWMVQLNIPFECENWHLSRLMTLIRIVGEKNSPRKKMSKNEIRRRNHAINTKRRAALHSRG